MPGYEDEPPVVYPETFPPPEHNGGQHNQSHHHSSHRHHRHHRHHHPSPQQYDYDTSYAAPPMRGHGYGHNAWGPSRSRSRSRSGPHTPIPSVYREPDSMELDDSYADPLARDDYPHMSGGVGGSKRSGHGPDGLDSFGHAQSQARIGWLPDGAEQQQMGEEPVNMNDPEATLVGNAEPQIIPGPFESNNPLQTNMYHTREPGYDPNMKHGRRSLAQDNMRDDRHRDPGAPRGSHGIPSDPRKKTYMYKDYHYSETIEPRMFERHPTHSEPDSEPEEYRYIVPTGVHVVFKDHDGNEITRYVFWWNG
ncbi:hypothetical protein P691DRAFT_221780 [Macrolepiota fuliginosa MF-IS2]|uniref:Uncharacterized protein n=1 Tax=Macrolepiota fuliginosa MF-IS2 TaxID=1400762 RepID=A0A9P5XKD3_9AGAR|nr:hypothetical protein P691DRAFT_221780 [Macrolepiota fuliginosa MF-IS2]